MNLLEQVREAVDADVMNFCIILYYLGLLMHRALLSPKCLNLESAIKAIISLWKVEST